MLDSTRAEPPEEAKLEEIWTGLVSIESLFKQQALTRNNFTSVQRLLGFPGVK